MVWILVVVLAVVLDQFSKYLIYSQMTLTQSIPVISGFFHITYWENKGAAFSMLLNARWFFVVLTSVVCVAISVILSRKTEKMLRLPLSLILGGALGNLIDRVYRGAVVDFFEFHFGNYTFPIFNIADICVVCGTILLGIYLIFFYEDKNVLKGSGVSEKHEND